MIGPEKMIKKAMLMLTLLVISPCAEAATIVDSYKSLFEGFAGCFILYEVTADKLVTEYDPESRCEQRIPSDSTFKIALSLMAYDRGLLKDDTVFKWNGKVNQDFPDWNKDQTPFTWQKYSVVWVSQQLTPQLGLPAILDRLKDFQYGNQDFSGDPGKNNGLTNAWLSSSLKISAREQIAFLRRAYLGDLQVTKEAVSFTMKTLYQGKLANGADYYGKTGSGWASRDDNGHNDNKLRDGWYIGYVTAGSSAYAYATNITDLTVKSDGPKFGGQVAKGIALKLLDQAFVK